MGLHPILRDGTFELARVGCALGKRKPGPMKAISLKLAATAFALATLAAGPAAADAVLHADDTGMIQVNGHKCLDVHAPEIGQNGGRVQVWRCNRAPQQIWRYQFPARTIRNAGGLCLDAHRPDMATNGGRVQVWQCNGTPQQRWEYDPNQRRIRNGAGLCLDAHAPESSTDGGRVQVWACGGQPNQQWQIISAAPPRAGEIRTAVGLCLDVHAPEIATNGGRVQIWQCNLSPQQTWTNDPATRNFRVASGLCLTAPAAANGAPVNVWACNDEWNQQFVPYPDGSLRTMGFCLDVPAPEQETNGARVRLWQCNGLQQQRFVWGLKQVFN